MSHPRLTCLHAMPGDGPGTLVCAKGHCPRNSHIGFCRQCPHNTDPAAKVTIAQPREQWPLTIRTIATFATAGDRGVGDTIERELGNGGVAFKAACAAVGFPCRCDDRKQWANDRYPYQG